MTYTLVGAPAVGFDLARLPGGARVAAVLRTTVMADPVCLAALAARHPGTVRDTWQALCERAGVGDARPRSTAEVLPEVAASLDDPTLAGVLRELETSLLGDVAALRRLVGHELLEQSWLRSGPGATQEPRAALAAEVLADAAVAAYLGGAVPDRLRRAMSLGLVGSGVEVRDEAVPTGVVELDARLAQLAHADEAVRQAWRGVVDAHRARAAAWAPAMHQATWALSLTDRLRLAFDAQMAAVGVFARAGFTARDAAYGVWNAWSGMVQATLAGDLLPAADADVLLAPWRAVHAS